MSKHEKSKCAKLAKENGTKKVCTKGGCCKGKKIKGECKEVIKHPKESHASLEARMIQNLKTTREEMKGVAKALDSQQET
jgi:hypothetical protein